MKFDSVVPYIKERLIRHHELYNATCKAEYWEENLSIALKQAGFGSDWQPDFNHVSGKDQTTDDGVRISNKSGTLYSDSVKISGSRLTKHKTIEDKIAFLSDVKEDYIFCLSTDKNKTVNRGYHLIVIDSQKINYHEQDWVEVHGADKMSGWSCKCEGFSADIKRTMSDQLWTKIKLDYCDQIYYIEI